MNHSSFNVVALGTLHAIYNAFQKFHQIPWIRYLFKINKGVSLN